MLSTAIRETARQAAAAAGKIDAALAKANGDGIPTQQGAEVLVELAKIKNRLISLQARVAKAVGD